MDLTEFRIGSTLLGEPPNPDDFLYAPLVDRGAYEPKGGGLELGAKDGVLDYIFLTIGEYRGRFTSKGISIVLSDTEDKILKVFGDPYWIDRSDGEVILFYEYQGGKIELQFEFPDGKKLGYITIALWGVLSSAEQREAYGVDSPWPPVKG